MTQIKKFDIKSLFEIEPTIIIIGRRETGKSVLVCDILDHYTKTQDLTDISFMEDLLPTEVINDISFLPKNGTVITNQYRKIRSHSGGYLFCHLAFVVSYWIK